MVSNHTGPLWSVGQPTAHAPGAPTAHAPGGWPAHLPAELQTTDDDDSDRY